MGRMFIFSGSGAAIAFGIVALLIGLLFWFGAPIILFIARTIGMLLIIFGVVSLVWGLLRGLTRGA